jgi:hypothetical protein
MRAAAGSSSFEREGIATESGKRPNLLRGPRKESVGEWERTGPPRCTVKKDKILCEWTASRMAVLETPPGTSHVLRRRDGS